MELTRKFYWIMESLLSDYPGKFVEFSVGLRRGAAKPNDGRDSVSSTLRREAPQPLINKPI